MLIVGEEDILVSLEELVLRDYCFHGTSKKIDDVLLPQPATDEVKESGNRNAVYMTINPLLAMFAALCGGRQVGKRQNQCYIEINDGKVSYPKKPFFAVEIKDNIAEEGYIYVVSRKTPGFEEINGEILSYEPVEPLFAIKMKRKEFKFPIESIS